MHRFGDKLVAGYHSDRAGSIFESMLAPWYGSILFDLLRAGLTRLTRVNVKVASGGPETWRYSEVQSTSCRKMDMLGGPPSTFTGYFMRIFLKKVLDLATADL